MSHRLRMVVPRSAHKGDSMPRGKAADDAGASKGVWYHFEVDLYPDGRLSHAECRRGTQSAIGVGERKRRRVAGELVARRCQ